MAAFGEKIQALMEEFYVEWQKEENKGKSKWDVLGSFSEAHQIAVVFGNFNYQVENGGLEQWVYKQTPSHRHKSCGRLDRVVLKIGGFLHVRKQQLIL